MPLLHSIPNLRKNFAARYSPWMIIGLAVILTLVITILAARNAQREKTHMSQTLMGRAESVIWSVEAVTRASRGMASRAGHIQSILEETAKQPGITYIAITDSGGNLVAFSKKERVGKSLYAPDLLKTLNAGEKSRWRATALPAGDKVFEVYRTFSPVPNFHRHMWHGSQDDTCGSCARKENDAKSGLPRNNDEERLLIFVGLTMQPFEDALAEDFRNTILTAGIVGLLGLGGVVSLFWANSYATSRRMLQDTKAFAAEVVTSLPSGLVTTDANGVITLINAAAEKIFGESAARLTGKSLRQHRGLPWEAIMERINNGAVILEEEHRLCPQQGEHIPVSVTASRITNDENTRLGFLFLLKDIRERKRLQEQLRRSERLSALGHMAARVAHEIRNPLSSIKGFARYFSEKSLEDTGRKVASTMMEEVDRLNRVVSELLDFARPSPLSLGDGDINDVITRALRLTEDDAKTKGVTPLFTPEPTLPRFPMDFERLTQVFLNIFINAVQATDRGGSLLVKASVVQNSRIAVTVADTGHGMPPDVLENIFLPYFTKKVAGTGLGLAIALKILEEHDSEIKVDSAVGRGTTVTLLFPIKAA